MQPGAVKAVCEKYGVPYVQESVFTRLGQLVDVMLVSARCSFGNEVIGRSQHAPVAAISSSPIYFICVLTNYWYYVIITVPPKTNYAPLLRASRSPRSKIVPIYPESRPTHRFLCTCACNWRDTPPCVAKSQVSVLRHHVVVLNLYFLEEVIRNINFFLFWIVHADGSPRCSQRVQ